MAPPSPVPALQPLVPADPRISQHDVPITSESGQILNYHYIQALPPSGLHPRATVLLLHGWPDTSLTWRQQIPCLTSVLHLRVVAPDMLGYGRTSAPADPAEYSLKNMAGHLRQLLRHILGNDEEKVILGGHDWGAALAWRMAGLWASDVVSAVFCLNVPYLPPEPAPYVPLESFVEKVPSLRYMVQLASPEAADLINAHEKNLRGLVNGIYDGRGPRGEEAFSVARGIHSPAELAAIGPARLMDGEWVEYYVQQLGSGERGFGGPLMWYKTRKTNFEDEREWAEGGENLKIGVRALVVMAEGDEALPPGLADGMEEHFVEGRLRKEVVSGGHWAHWERWEDVNGLLGDWLGGVLDGESHK